jgi:hypothetical protein
LAVAIVPSYFRASIRSAGAAIQDRLRASGQDEEAENGKCNKQAYYLHGGSL